MKRTLFCISIIVITISCQKEIPLNIDESTSVVVNCIFQPDQEEILLHLSESRALLEKAEYPDIENATIELFDKENNLVDSFPHFYNGFYKLENTAFIAGKVYQVVIDVPGYETVRALSIAPTVTTFSEIDTIPKGTSRMEFEFSFDDNPYQDNFYAVSIHYFYTFKDSVSEETKHGRILNSSTNDIIVANGTTDLNGKKLASEFLFTDKTFNGQTFTYSGQQTKNSQEWVDPGAYWIITLKSLSEDIYNYQLSYENYKGGEDSPLSEPITVYSNVANGLGIFGGISIYKDTVWVSE